MFPNNNQVFKAAGQNPVMLTPYGCGSKKWNSKINPGKRKHGPKPAVCPSGLILGHTHINQPTCLLIGGCFSLDLVGNQTTFGGEHTPTNELGLVNSGSALPPVNIPTPTKTGSKICAPKTPKWPLVLNHSHLIDPRGEKPSEFCPDTAWSQNEGLAKWMSFR